MAVSAAASRSAPLAQRRGLALNVLQDRSGSLLIFRSEYGSSAPLPLQCLANVSGRHAALLDDPIQGTTQAGRARRRWRCRRRQRR